MRIAYVLTSLGIGGAERQTVALAERMKARGHQVALVVLRPHLPEQWPTSLDFFHLDMRKTPAGVIAGAFKARRFLRGFRPDLIHSHTFPANMTARLLHLALAAPVISTIHNVYEGSWLRMLAYRLTDPLCLRTTAVCQAAAERFARLRAVPAHKLSVLTNGIDTAEFTHDSERRARLRAEMGAGAEFIWLAAGRVVPAKDYPNLLRAFAQVRAKSPQSQLWIAGAAEAAGAIQTLSRDLGASVRWLGLRRDMPALLDAADAFVLASAWEGMPLAVGEAMAMRKPVVATDVGGVREFVGDSGVIVPAKNAERLAEAMLGLMQLPLEARLKMGRKASVQIRDTFSMDAKADAWEALYQSEITHLH